MNKTNLTDIELWQEFHSGNDEALTIIYKRYDNKLYDYGLRIVNDRQLVQDCIHEIFIRLIDKRNTIIINSNIHTYLLKSLRNKLLEEWRSRKRKLEINLAASQEKDDILNDAENAIIQNEEHNEIRTDLLRAMKNLTDKQREIIYLKFSKGFNYDEIAGIMEIDKASARTLLYRTLKSIKEKLGNHT